MADYRDELHDRINRRAGKSGVVELRVRLKLEVTRILRTASADIKNRYLEEKRQQNPDHKPDQLADCAWQDIGYHGRGSRHE